MKKPLLFLLTFTVLASSFVAISAQKADKVKTPRTLPRQATPRANLGTIDERNNIAAQTTEPIRPEKADVLPHSVIGPIGQRPPVLSREEILDRQEELERVNHTVPIPQGEVWDEIPRPTNPPTKPVTANPELSENFLTKTSERVEALGPNDLRYQVVHDLNLSETGSPFIINEPSVGNMGDTVFLTGNRYAAVSTDKGRTFRYVSPSNTFPASNAGFCCDQIINHAPQQDMMLWALQYYEDGSTNTLRIARAVGSSDVSQNRWTYYDLTPQGFGFPTGTWLDFPNLTISANYLYVTSNVFTHAGAYTGAVLVRYLLSELAAGATLHGEYYAQSRSASDVGGLRCTEGAGFTMFCAGLKTTSQVRIFGWNDGAGSPISFNDVNLQPYTRIMCNPTCDGVAISPDGSNWAARTDSRILGAWVSQGIIGLMWAARQDASFPYPYTIVAQFDQTTKSLISQTPVWSPDTAYLYPTVAVNSSRNLAGLISYGGGAFTPGSLIWISDDIESGFSPLHVYGAAPGSTNGPNNNAWGDFQTVRRHRDSTNTWVASTFRLQGGSDDSSIVPRYLWFGRVRDLPAALPGNANLINYRPSGWSDAIVLSKVPGTSTDDTSFTTANTIYVDWAVLNNGNSWTEAKYYIYLYVDGVQKASWYSAPTLPNDYVYIQDYSLGTLSAGTHTIKIVADPTNAITESNELDNEYTRSLTVAQAPPNDNFANAQVISGTSGNVAGTNVNGTKESGEPAHAGNAGGASVWYQWQAPATGSATISTGGSNFDTLLGIYTGTNVASLTTIASNDDENYPTVLTSRVNFNAVSGTIYRIAVDGFSGASGNISLSWNLQPIGLRIDSVTPPAGRTSGGQQIRLVGAFANLSAVSMGGVSASWFYTNGSGNTSAITVTTPAHAVGAVQIDLTPTSGSPYSKPNAFAYLPTVFTDDTISVGQTTAKAQHIIELRQAVDALRAVAGLPPAPWTEGTLAPTSSIIKIVHIQELRTYLDDAATRLGYSTQPYTEPTLAAGSVIKRIHIEELRQRMRAMAG